MGSREELELDSKLAGRSLPRNLTAGMHMSDCMLAVAVARLAANMSCSVPM